MFYPPTTGGQPKDSLLLESRETLTLHGLDVKSKLYINDFLHVVAVLEKSQIAYPSHPALHTLRRYPVSLC